jgi:hypothetical protein
MKRFALPLTPVATHVFQQTQESSRHQRKLNASRSERPGTQAKVLTLAEFSRLSATADHMLIIDVLTSEQVQQTGRFPVYLGIEPIALASSLAWLPRDRTIVTVSSDGVRNIQAADLLIRSGFNVAGAVGISDVVQGSQSCTVASSLLAIHAGNGRTSHR